MTLSLINASTAWDRTLPRPASLLSNGVLNAYTRRSSSLLQHHINSSKFVSPSVDESGRRESSPCISLSNHLAIPPTPPSGEHGNTAAGRGDDVNSSLDRTRKSSVMSIEGPSSSSSPSSTSPAEATNNYCLCQPEPKIPRPRNAFILYRQHQHAGVVARNPGLPNPDISKIIGEQWRQLPLKDKDEWKALAEQEKVRHSQQFPEYRYRPKRNGRYSIQSSVTEGHPTGVNDLEICTKCRGKIMNPPHTPHYSPFTPVTSAIPSVASVPRHMKRTYAEAQIQSPRSQMAVPISMQRAVPARYAYLPREHATYDQPVHYTLPPSATPIETPETKRRRLNSISMYGSRNAYPDASLVYGSGDSTHISPGSLRRIQMSSTSTIPTTHVSYMPHSQPSNVRDLEAPVTPNNNREAVTILPPLRTPVSAPKPSSSSNAQTQKSGIEAMIMSYPVLTKLKTLSSITPTLASPGPASPDQEIRGAIIAVEGMDQTSVNSMTNSLVEQLERDGKFAVKIFRGPDPYQALESSRRASAGGEGESMSTEKYLSMITEWHKMSKELVRYITTIPKSGSNTIAYDAGASSEVMYQQEKHDSSQTVRSPISAISPKTIIQTADLSLETPKRKRSGSTQLGSTATHNVSNSRIPASALLEKQKALNSQTADLNAITEQRSVSDNPEEVSASDLRRRTYDDKSSHESPIPIAIVPHYQLTTVDAYSIALPITDNYDPITHWRWHATLWRGCVGHDVAVVIKSAHEQYEEEVSAEGSNEARLSTSSQNQTSQQSSAQSTPQQSSPFGVEVRLQDCRAVVVKGVGSRSDERGAEQSLGDNENWEKAKRRVGFEVEEYLRR